MKRKTFYFSFICLNKGLTIGCQWFAWRTHTQMAGPAPSRTHPRPGLSGDKQSAQLEGRGIRRQQPRQDISTSWIYHWLKFNLKLNHQLAGKWHLKKGKPGPSQPQGIRSPFTAAAFLLRLTRETFCTGGSPEPAQPGGRAPTEPAYLFSFSLLPHLGNLLPSHPFPVCTQTCNLHMASPCNRWSFYIAFYLPPLTNRQNMGL